MRIGIVPALSGSGGVYQYSLSMLRALEEWKRDGAEDDFVVFVEDPHPVIKLLQEAGLVIKPFHSSKYLIKIFLQRGGKSGERLRQAWRQFRPQPQLVAQHIDPDRIKYRNDMSRLFQRYGIELMLYPVPLPLSFEAQVPYVMAIHDLQHRLQPEFPEVSANGQADRREYIFRNGARHAILLLADSEVGKEDILNCYSSEAVTPDRVKILPFLPASYLADDIPIAEQQRVRRLYNLPDKYLFYPAQFWSHKNHARIVEALGLLRRTRSLEIPIVFSGSNSGEGRDQVFQECIAIARRLNIERQVHYLGYVADNDMSALYAGAVALVMPTFFGPTNIPVLEAWAFGCPVLTSDIRGIREQVGDAGILVDPHSTEDIADGIYRLWSDESLRQGLSERGRRRLASYTPDDFRMRLIDIVNEAKARVSKR